MEYLTVLGLGKNTVLLWPHCAGPTTRSDAVKTSSWLVGGVFRNLLVVVTTADPKGESCNAGVNFFVVLSCMRAVSK